MAAEIFSILNFETENGAVQPNSPRTLEACLRSGIDPSELMPRALKDYKQKGIPLAKDGVARGKQTGWLAQEGGGGTEDRADGSSFGSALRSQTLTALRLDSWLR